MTVKSTNNSLKSRIKELESEAEELRKSEKFLRRIMDESSIPTLVIDRNHIITHLNKSYEKVIGIRADEMIGTQKQWMTFYSEERPVMVDFIVDGAPEDQIYRYFKGKCRRSPIASGAFEGEAFFPERGDSGEWLFFTATPLKDEKGDVMAAIETCQDVTQRRQAEFAYRESQKRFRAMLDFIPYPFSVFRLDGTVAYVNPAFTRVFGWTLEELQGKHIPFIPSGLKNETIENIRRLYKEKFLLRHETERRTKDGRILDVSIRAVIYAESGDEPSGIAVIFRDITREKRIARNNEAILRISTALPEYPVLEELLYYINSQVKELLGTEGSVVILRDEEKDELFILGASYDAPDTQKRVSTIRFSMDQLVAGTVIRSGEPIIVSNTSQDAQLHRERDKKLGYKTKNLLLVPLKSKDTITGVLCAINKKKGGFEQPDIDLLNMISGTVALSIENARVSDKLKTAYEEVKSLNRAKDKVISHLSHELKTPVAILTGALGIIAEKLESVPEKTWERNLEMALRNLERIVDIQYEVADIMDDREQRSYHILNMLLDQCADELEVLLEKQGAEVPVLEEVRKCIRETFGPREMKPDEIALDDFVRERLDFLKGQTARRQVHIKRRLASAPTVWVPGDALQKVVDGLIRNAVENTPDEGAVEVRVHGKGEGAELVVRDFGVGIHKEARQRIFEGFFATQETLAYSSKKPFDFNAGGKGADLLRMKIFAERYDFEINMISSRCRFIPEKEDACPGRISQCPHCSGLEECLESGGTTFSLYFPPAAKKRPGPDNG